MEKGIEFLRTALTYPHLAPDGLPLNVPPAQTSVPFIVGAAAKPAIDRATRLGDGHFAYGYVNAEKSLPDQWRDRIEPAMAAHGRTRDDFHLVFTTVVWPSLDYKHEWMEYVGPAFQYQQQKYNEWAGSGGIPDGVLSTTGGVDRLLSEMLVGPPAEVAERLSRIREVYPYHEIVIWPQLPGVPLDLAERCLACFANEVIPRIR
jgi:alkanesulfonate monooxygenase SsuD/methylene tetrahydromethanopterin reductase-like flavin-dependent oxidoreductase (luciferase family)